MVAYSPRDVAGASWILAKNRGRLGGIRQAAEGSGNADKGEDMEDKPVAASTTGLTSLSKYLLVSVTSAYLLCPACSHKMAHVFF